jgi:7-cyano-7-deazaguanine synthase
MPVDRVCLYSGGLDSTTLLWSLRPNVKALLINYGQRHAVELVHAAKLCNTFGIDYETADLSGINRLIHKGSQSGDELPPDGHYAEETMKTTIVPNRNSIMLSVAVGWAVATGCKEVYFAAHAGDHTIYPDCRRQFIDKFAEAMIEANLWNPVLVRAPFVLMNKSDIVKLANNLGVPFQMTWSCYKGDKIHCGKCGTCTERREAFQLADINDTTEYEYTGPLMEAK